MEQAGDKTYRRHQAVWRVFYPLLHGWICRRFRLEHEDLQAEGPVLLISNHVTNWDPLLVSMSLRNKQVYFVASEHIFRLGWVSRLLNWLLGPIPRSKGAGGGDAAWTCTRKLRAGQSICLFAEGECTWDGRSGQVFPATGKLVKLSKATLVTYRLEGGYFTLPRWAGKRRPGRMYGHPVGVYPPERLKTMTPEEIDALINRDIYEDAWERQREQPVAYCAKAPAQGLERAMYLCPACGRIGGLGTKGNRISCGCGFSLTYTAQGGFSPETPFRTIPDWDGFQREKLLAMDFPPEDPETGLLFSDEGLTLSRIEPGHREYRLSKGTLRQYRDRLECAGKSFLLDRIREIAMVKANRLLFTYDADYYQIRSKGTVNLRKYLELCKGAEALENQ